MLAIEQICNFALRYSGFMAIGFDVSIICAFATLRLLSSCNLLLWWSFLKVCYMPVIGQFANIKFVLYMVCEYEVKFIYGLLFPLSMCSSLSSPLF